MACGYCIGHPLPTLLEGFSPFIFVGLDLREVRGQPSRAPLIGVYELNKEDDGSSLCVAS